MTKSGDSERIKSTSEFLCVLIYNVIFDMKATVPMNLLLLDHLNSNRYMHALRPEQTKQLAYLQKY